MFTLIFTIRKQFENQQQKKNLFFFDFEYLLFYFFNCTANTTTLFFRLLISLNMCFSRDTNISSSLFCCCGCCCCSIFLFVFNETRATLKQLKNLKQQFRFRRFFFLSFYFAIVANCMGLSDKVYLCVCECQRCTRINVGINHIVQVWSGFWTYRLLSYILLSLFLIFVCFFFFVILLSFSLPLFFHSLSVLFSTLSKIIYLLVENIDDVSIIVCIILFLHFTHIYVLWIWTQFLFFGLYGHNGVLKISISTTVSLYGSSYFFFVFLFLSFFLFHILLCFVALYQNK